MPSQKILLELDKQTARIFFNNPGKFNALSPDMVEELLSLLRTLEENDEVRVVFLRGTGGNFSSGADLEELEKFTPLQALKFHKKMNEIVHLMTHSGKIFVSVLEGYSLGGGFELSLSTDIRVGAEDATLGQPEINVGLNAGAGGNAILPRIVGKSNAMYMVLTGEKITARRAYDLGILQKIVAKDQLEDELRELAAKILKHPGVSTSLSKMAVNGSQDATREASMDIETLVFSLLQGNEEVKKKIKKFLEKEY